MLLLWVDLLLLGEKHYNYSAKRICNLTSLWVKKVAKYTLIYFLFLINSLLISLVSSLSLTHFPHRPPPLTCMSSPSSLEIPLAMACLASVLL
jgi:hypothetical protein